MRIAGGGDGSDVEPSLIFLFEDGDRKFVLQGPGFIDTGIGARKVFTCPDKAEHERK